MKGIGVADHSIHIENDCFGHKEGLETENSLKGKPQSEFKSAKSDQLIERGNYLLDDVAALMKLLFCHHQRRRKPDDIAMGWFR